MTFDIAIPSYKRTDVLNRNTLRLIRETGIDLDRVTVWVANEEEAEQYRAAVTDCRIAISAPGIGASRAAYTAQYPATTKLWSMDDDVDAYQTAAANKLVTYTDWPAFVEEAFAIAVRLRIRLFGINAAANPMFMNDRYVTGLRYIIASSYGSWGNDPLVVNYNGPDNGEDFVKSMTHYQRHGAVLRFDGITVKSKYFAAGGIEAFNGGKQERVVDYKKQIVKIAAAYPELCSVVAKGETGNLRLKSITTSRVPYLPPGLRPTK